MWVYFLLALPLCKALVGKDGGWDCGLAMICSQEDSRRALSLRLLSKDIAHVARSGMELLGQMSLTRIGSELLLVPPEEPLDYASVIASQAYGISAPSERVISNASRMTSKPGQPELGNGLVDKMLAAQT